MNNFTSFDKRLLKPNDVQKIFNITKKTELSWRKQGILPQPIVLSRSVFYRAEDIEAVILNQSSYE
jgi:predicted DNA-binding transcriptional regulator AlpA